VIIYVVIVLYNCKLSKSHTVNSLLRIYPEKIHKKFDVRVLVYDNGLNETQDNPPIHEGFEYLSAAENRGLTGAYNYAIKRASEQSADWILLLDQDTKLPVDYFDQLHNAVSEHCDNPKIVAVVPKMHYENVFFSPAKVLYAGIMRPVERDYLGIYPREIFAIGSCSLIKVNFIKSIGGFSDKYWLDSQDRWLYHKIHSFKKEVLITGIVVEHELSVMDFDKFVTESRYENILKYEVLFMREHCSFFENIIFALRLAFRSVKLVFIAKNKNYSLITAKQFLGLITDIFCRSSKFNGF
jgi:GT2 family glycosyltransferase